MITIAHLRANERRFLGKAQENLLMCSVSWTFQTPSDIADYRNIKPNKHTVGVDAYMPKKRQQRPRAVQHKRIAWRPSANPALREAILAVVDQQMRDNTPPETQRTFERLVALGYASEDA